MSAYAMNATLRVLGATLKMQSIVVEQIMYIRAYAEVNSNTWDQPSTLLPH